MAGSGSTHREMINAYQILVGELEGEGTLQTSKRTREDNIKMERTSWLSG
jgi:hypothetical protein